MKPFVLPPILLLFALFSCFANAADPHIQFLTEFDRVKVLINSQEVAHYVFRDSEITRPYFAHIKTRTGKQVSRNHPPREGVDKTDHASMHPGIWLSFGDINGHDYWRLNAATKHIQFIAPPTVSANVGSFTVLNHYLATSSEANVCSQVCEVQVRTMDSGYILLISNEFKPFDEELRFGDQEEMGLGVRVATRLAVEKKLGGRILDSEGRVNGEQVWGNTAAWCDYSGPMDGAWVGMTVLTSLKNFRSSWSHARDYGFVAMNPFGLNAFTKADKQEIVVKNNQSLKLGYAVVVHESLAERDYDPKMAFATFVELER